MNLLDIDQAAEALTVSPVTVRRLVRDGKLPGYKIRNCLRFKPADLEAYVDTCLIESSDQMPKTRRAPRTRSRVGEIVDLQARRSASNG